MTLHNVINSFILREGALFPHYQPEIALYAVFTDGRGRHTIHVELVTWDESGQEETLFQTRSVVVELGSDPLAVRGWPVRLRDLRFPRPGLYEFRLCSADEILAREPILWRLPP